jgi:Na+/melibiose symporter-like transporter
MKWIMTALLVLGSLLCCLNFYLSFLRYPVHRIMGKKKEEYQWISGFPVFGSLFVAISLFKFWQPPWLLATAIILILIDTGGLHWFAGTMLWYEVLKKGNRPTTGSTVPSEGTSLDGQ